MGGKPLSVVYINNPVFGGFFRLAKDCQSGFLVVNTVGDPLSDPDVANAAPTRGVTPDRARSRRRRRPRPRGQIDGVARWRATSDVARATRTAACSWPATPST